MKRTIHPAIGYTVIIIGGAFLAAAIFVIAKVGTPNIVWNQNFVGSALHKPPTEEKISTIKDEIGNKSMLFSDSELTSSIAITPEHFIFNQILSNSGDKIVYAEISNCQEKRGYMDCAWDYSIKVFDAVKNQTTTLYTQDNKIGSPSYNAIIYYPVAWSKNDKKNNSSLV